MVPHCADLKGLGLVSEREHLFACSSPKSVNGTHSAEKSTSLMFWASEAFWNLEGSLAGDQHLGLGSLTANFERLLRKSSTAVYLRTMCGFSANFERLLRKP